MYTTGHILMVINTSSNFAAEASEAQRWDPLTLLVWHCSYSHRANPHPMTLYGSWGDGARGRCAQKDVRGLRDSTIGAEALWWVKCGWCHQEDACDEQQGSPQFLTLFSEDSQKVQINLNLGFPIEIGGQ